MFMMSECHFYFSFTPESVFVAEVNFLHFPERKIFLLCEELHQAVGRDAVIMGKQIPIFSDFNMYSDFNLLLVTSQNIFHDLSIVFVYNINLFLYEGLHLAGKGAVVTVKLR